MSEQRQIRGILVEFRDLGDKVELVFDCGGQRVVECCPKADGLLEYLQAVRGDQLIFYTDKDAV